MKRMLPLTLLFVGTFAGCVVATTDSPQAADPSMSAAHAAPPAASPQPMAIGVAAGTPDHGFFTPDTIQWMQGPPSLPAGARVAVLEGDATKEGFFTMRLWMPDGYSIAPHSHPKFEHVTVISGQFNMGMGETVDPSAYRAMPAGSFTFMAPGMRHYARTTGETVIQVHSIGPWAINYVRPEDDPRTRR